MNTLDIWKNCLDKIQSFSTFEDPVSDDIIKTANNLINFLQNSNPNNPPSLVTSMSGFILFVWHLPQEKYIEAEISLPNVIEWMENKGENKFEHWNWNLNSLSRN